MWFLAMWFITSRRRSERLGLAAGAWAGRAMRRRGRGSTNCAGRWSDPAGIASPVRRGRRNLCRRPGSGQARPGRRHQGHRSWWRPSRAAAASAALRLRRVEDVSADSLRPSSRRAVAAARGGRAPDAMVGLHRVGGSRLTGIRSRVDHRRGAAPAHEGAMPRVSLVAWRPPQAVGCIGHAPRRRPRQPSRLTASTNVDVRRFNRQRSRAAGCSSSPEPITTVPSRNCCAPYHAIVVAPRPTGDRRIPQVNE